MKPEQHAVINELRHEGYAVVIWTPQELRGASRNLVEDVVSERGNLAIDDLATEPEEHEGEDELYRCDNCEFECRYGDLPPAKNLGERLDPNGPYTNVECPRCGALCYPIEQKSK
jgi:predicted RNA-binding Zn-ribbon protein involved in translation (DUF1610 family)